MADRKALRDKMKFLWIRGMKAVGNTAANIANNTRYKVDEVTIQNRRREVLNDLAHKTYALWLKGEEFPESMSKMLEELKRLDEQMNDIRAEKYASSNSVQEAGYEAEQTESDTQNNDEDDGSCSLDINSPVSAEINELFDGSSSVGKTAEKVNQTLEQLSDRIRNFSQTEKTDDNG